MSKEQTALERIKDEVAKEHGMDTCAFALNVCAKNDARRIDLMINEIAQRFARECCQATLKEAAENATVLVGAAPIQVNKESITNPENICIL